MRQAVLLCIALTGCAFEGAEGDGSLDPDPSPASQQDVGPANSISGTIATTATIGALGAAILEPGDTLDAAHPCLAQDHKFVWAKDDGSFQLSDLAEGPHTLVVFRIEVGNQVITNFERTLHDVTVSASEGTAIGTVELPPRFDATSPRRDRVSWTLPPRFVPTAYRLGFPNACDGGTALSLTTDTEVTSPRNTWVRVAVENAATRQLAVDIERAK